MTTPQISVQLYSVNRPLVEDLNGTLGRLADIGFTNVEAFDFVRRVDELKRSFAQHGLSAPTGHAILIDENAATPDGILTAPTAEETFEAAVALGIETVIDPYVAPADWASLHAVERTAARLNERAQQAAGYGLRVGYHNHDHELTSMIDGTPALEVFATYLDPAVVLEVDLYWATAGGQDAAALLTRFGERVQAVHVKDGPMHGHVSTTQMPTDQVPAGQGDVPLAAALAAGENIRYAVIEFDSYRGDIFDGISASYAYLTTLLHGASGDEPSAAAHAARS